MMEAIMMSGVIDPKRKQVACVILQAVMGGDRRVCSFFDDWITAPTDDMVRISGTAEQWRGLAAKWNSK